MKEIDPGPSGPIQFHLDDGTIIGQFYNSYDKLYHLAFYEPYRMPPRKFLCTSYGNFSPSRSKKDIKKCPVCWSLLEAIGAK